MSAMFPSAPRRPLPRVPARAGLCLLLAALALGAATPPLAAQTVKPYGFRPTAAVFAADGAGNFKAASAYLRKVVTADGLPLEVYPFDWSHGYCRIFSDQVIYGHTCDCGRRMADEVLSYHAAHPEVPIYLYAHSAGCTVAMKALESLPPCVVERAILLSPSLSAEYDLCPGLERVRSGLHVFYSRQDWWYLGMSMHLLGTADRRFFSCCSGRHGFEEDALPLDCELRAKLCQREWQPEDRALGNNGGHYGNYQPDFLRVHVIPLMCP